MPLPDPPPDLTGLPVLQRRPPRALEALLTCVTTLVPAGPAGESAERDPVHEPEGNAGGKSPGFVPLIFVHVWLG